jgi:hypothetical protein
MNNDKLFFEAQQKQVDSLIEAVKRTQAARVQNPDQHENKGTVDMFVGVGDEPQAQTESEAYRLAH